MYKFLCGHTSSVLLGKQPTVELLSHMVTLCLTVSGIAKLFSKVTHQQCMRVPIFHIVFDLVLIYISLVTNDAEHLSCAYWLMLYPLWGNVYSDPLFTF